VAGGKAASADPARQLVIAAGVTPGAHMVVGQAAVHVLQAGHFLRTATVMAGDPPGQFAVFHFQLGADKLNAELVSPGLQYQRRRCRTDRHLCTGVHFRSHRQHALRTHQFVPVFLAEQLCLLTQPVLIHAGQEGSDQHLFQLITGQLTAHAVQGGQGHPYQPSGKVAFTERKA